MDRRIVRWELGRPVEPWLAWAEQLATTRLAISTPTMLGWFRRWNARDPRKPDGPQKPYRSRVKPFGFLHHAPLDAALGTLAGTAPGARLNFVAPYGERRWWVNLHEPAGERVRVVQYQASAGDSSVVIGCRYGDLIAAHPFHPEAKSLDPEGMPCQQRTVGLLGRRSVVATETVVIGKEANEMERVEAGLIDELEAVQIICGRDRSEEFREMLHSTSVKAAMELTRLSRRQMFYLRAGRRGTTGTTCKPDRGYCLDGGQ